ncbi:MAG: redoxin domain-containing protein [Anaerolineales bacterium]|nr:redoxin domain-containing protein [Anaerolineales bacterium]
MQTNQTAPDFSLPDLEDRVHQLSDYTGRIVVINFWSAECPWVTRADEQMLQWGREWGDQVVYLPVASNMNESRELMAGVSRQRGLWPVLLDEEQAAADLFQAQITPHVYVIDWQGVLRYQGAFDDVTFCKRAPEHLYTHEAVLALLNAELPDPAETTPYGCMLVRSR